MSPVETVETESLSTILCEINCPPGFMKLCLRRDRSARRSVWQNFQNAMSNSVNAFKEVSIIPNRRVCIRASEVTIAGLDLRHSQQHASQDLKTIVSVHWTSTFTFHPIKTFKIVLIDTTAEVNKGFQNKNKSVSSNLPEYDAGTFRRRERTRQLTL